jgi:hypothetical protein
MLSPTLGRVLSAVGAVVVAVALVLTWYHIGPGGDGQLVDSTAEEVRS